MSKDLIQRGFRFVGPTICYAHMQATGMVNDHQLDCFRCAPVRKTGVEAGQIARFALIRPVRHYARSAFTAASTRAPYSGSAAEKCAIARSTMSARDARARLPAMFSTRRCRSSSFITR
jgi:hypothetical protein